MDSRGFCKELNQKVERKNDTIKGYDAQAHPVVVFKETRPSFKIWQRSLVKAGVVGVGGVLVSSDESDDEDS